MTDQDVLPLGGGRRDGLASAFDAYFETVSKIHVLATSREAGDSLKLVALRKDLARQFQDMNREVADVTRAVGVESEFAPDLAECNAMLTTERGAVAEHQSRWNAPAMHRDRDGYERDTRILFRLHQQNHRWRKSVLLPKLLVIRARARSQG